MNIIYWVLINRAPSSTQLHPPPTSSIHLHPAHFSLHPALCKNIAHNWAISPNFGRKIQSCPFWLKIGSHGILEVLISNLDLDFWNSDPKIQFWANLSPKKQSCLFCLKIGTHGISRMLVFIPTWVFWYSDHKIHFWANLDPKSQSCPLPENWHIWYLKNADSYSNIIFLNFQT